MGLTKGIRQGWLHVVIGKRKDDYSDTFAPDHNKLRKTKEKLDVVKEKPKLKSEYRDNYTFPTKNMEHNNQVKLSCGHVVLRDTTSILLLSCNGLVQPP